MTGKPHRSGGDHYKRLTNMELQQELTRLKEILESHGISDVKEPEPEFEAEPPVQNTPSEYELAEAAHEEYVKPFVEEWESKVTALFHTLCAQYHENHGGGIYDSHATDGYTKQGGAVEKMRDRAERALPYEGPEPDYHRYKNKKALKEFKEAQSDQSSPTFVDDFGMLRHTKSGVRVLNDEPTQITDSTTHQVDENFNAVATEAGFGSD